MRALHWLAVTVSMALLLGCTDQSSGVGSATGSGIAGNIGTPGTGSGGSGSTSSSSITLGWAAPTANIDGTALTDLAGYRIYYGTSADAMTESVDIDSAQTTSYVLRNLTPGTWYFAVRAVTSGGIESGMSNVASASI